METVIKIENLRKEYKMYSSKKSRLLELIFPKYENHKIFKALDNFDLELNKGEILGVLGRNGAGKSTLLKLITGVATPTAGTIKVQGKISSLLELGTAFNPELTGYENIYQHGQIMGLSNDEIKLREEDIISFADIGDHLSQPVKTYSSGMFARLAFACAINVNPDILIVDEVLSVGDMAFQLKCFKKFEEFKKSGKTIIFVSHSLPQIISNCNRAIILNDGIKIFDGDVKTAVDKYKKVIVGLDADEENKTENQNWKEKSNANEELLAYGNQKAEIIDFGVFDANGEAVPIFYNDDEINVRLKVRFNETVDDPIFAFSVKDFTGKELCGTNTAMNKIITGTYRKDEEIEINFQQIIPLSSDRYTLSFGCTKYTLSGELEVFDRKYDALFIEILSNQEMVGYVRLNPKIKIRKKK